MSTTTAIIKSLRESHGLSQAEIARRTGIPQPRLSRWENGEAPAGADDALKLAALDAELAQAAPKGEEAPAAEPDLDADAGPVADRRHDAPDAPASRDPADPQLWPAKAEQRAGGDRRLQPRDGEGVRDAA